MRIAVFLAASGLVTGLAALAAADTLVLNNGRRVEGRLVGASASEIEFEERGSGRPRVRSYERSEVRRIEIEDERDSGFPWGGGGGSGGSSSTAGQRERTVTVDAATEWTDTGIDVRRGQEISFRASGKVRWGPGREDGPGGEGGNHYNQARPMPNRPGAALIGKVGRGDDVFFIGNDDGPIRIRDGGRLFLGVNDDYLQDNRGSFRVTVYY